MTVPETINDEDGKWRLRQEFAKEVEEEFIDEDDVDEERVSEVIDGMIEKGSMKSKMHNGKEYIQIVSIRKGLTEIIKYKARRPFLRLLSK